jgi:autotransporter-associated beta strand protein
MAANPITLSGTGNGVMGALNGGENFTVTGPITLLADSMITHDWNYFWVNSTITGNNKNLELAVTVGGQVSLIMSSSINLGSGMVTISGVANAAPVELDAANSYSGGTAVINNGTLQLDTTNALGSGSLTVASGGTVNLNGQSVTITSLSGASGATITDESSSVGPTTITTTQGVRTTFNGAINDGPTNQLALTMQGTASLDLGGTNSYSGPTTVSSGELVGITTGSCSNTVVEIAAGASNGVQVAAAGGQWTCAGLTYDPGTEYLVFNFGAVTPSTNIAPLLVNGNLTINGTVNMTILNGTWSGAGSYPLIQYTGTLLGMPTLKTLPPNVVGTLVNDTTNQTISLDVTSAPPAPPTILPVSLSIITGTSTNLVLPVVTVAGHNYVLESTPGLGGTNVWTPVSTNAGTGGTITLTVPVIPALQEQFFRFLVQ